MRPGVVCNERAGCGPTRKGAGIMRVWLKRLGTVLVVLVLAAAGVLAFAWWKTDRAMARVYAVNDPPLTVANDAEARARGGHLYATRGCADCHGDNGGGRLVVDAGPVMHLVAPNITSGGRLRGLSVDA